MFVNEIDALLLVIRKKLIERGFGYLHVDNPGKYAEAFDLLMEATRLLNEASTKIEYAELLVKEQKDEYLHEATSITTECVAG